MTNDLNEQDKLLTVKQAALFLNFGTQAIYSWHKQGILPGYRIGPQKNLRFRSSDLQKYLSQGFIPQKRFRPREHIEKGV